MLNCFLSPKSLGGHVKLYLPTVGVLHGVLQNNHRIEWENRVPVGPTQTTHLMKICLNDQVGFQVFLLSKGPEGLPSIRASAHPPTQHGLLSKELQRAPTNQPIIVLLI